MRQSVAVVVSLSALLLVSLDVRGQQCGVPPGSFQYSENFLRAEAKFLQASSSNSSQFGATIPVIDLPINGSSNSSSSVTNWQTLNLQQARQFIQQEHAAKGAQIVAECGYRLCTLLSSHTPSSLAAISALSDVCNQTALPDLAGELLSVSPRSQAIAFTTSALQSRTVTVSNNSPGIVTVRWSIDPGTATSGQGSVSITGVPKEFAIAPKQSRAVTVTIRKPSGGAVESPRLVFQAVSDKNVTARVDFAIYPDPALLLPPATITPGPLYPNAKIQNDQDNPTPVFRAEHPGPYSFPVPQQGPQMSNPGGSNAGAKAVYKATLTGPTTSQTQASVVMSMDATVGGTCGTGASGGAAGVNPQWGASLGLPALPDKQIWKIGVTTDLRYVTDGSGSCRISLGSQIEGVNKVGVTTKEFKVPGGSYDFSFRCDGPNPYNGCYGHAGGVNDHYEEEHFVVHVEANRVKK